MGCILRALLKFSNFYDGKMFHQISGDKLLPDAQISASKNNEDYRMAIEVELTQKEVSRVKNKYRLYSGNKEFNYVLFITNKETLFKTYKKYLLEMNPEIQASVILLLDKSLTVNRFDYLDSHLFYEQKEWSFLEIFG